MSYLYYYRKINVSNLIISCSIFQYLQHSALDKSPCQCTVYLPWMTMTSFSKINGKPMYLIKKKMTSQIVMNRSYLSYCKLGSFEGEKKNENWEVSVYSRWLHGSRVWSNLDKFDQHKKSLNCLQAYLYWENSYLRCHLKWF